MLKERGEKIISLIDELQKEYIAYFHEAKKYGMSWEQISKPTDILDTMKKKFESLNRFVLKQDEMNNKQVEPEFKSRF